MKGLSRGDATDQLESEQDRTGLDKTGGNGQREDKKTTEPVGIEQNKTSQQNWTGQDRQNRTGQERAGEVGTRQDKDRRGLGDDRTGTELSGNGRNTINQSRKRGDKEKTEWKSDL